MDFSKVPHNRLLLKLKYSFIRNNILDWIKNFLNNSQQSVAVDGESSAPAPVLSGVPQGSVIGPALLLIYVKDLPNGIKSKLRLFADNTIMYLTINNGDDCQQLQHDLTLLQRSGEEWQIEFNTSKCEVLRVSRACTQIPFTYVLNGARLTETDYARYLSTHISKDLRWNKHIDVITAKANSSLGFLKRNRKVPSSSLREKAYIGFVPPPPA